MKKRNGWLYAFWILIIVIVVVVLAAGAIMWAGSSDNEELSDSSATVTGVTLDKEQLNLETEGEMATGTLTATVTTDTGETFGGAFSWTSSNEDVATVEWVDEIATVTAVAEGTTVVTVVVGGESATCLVKVSEPEPEPEPVLVAELTVTESFSMTVLGFDATISEAVLSLYEDGVGSLYVYYSALGGLVSGPMTISCDYEVVDGNISLTITGFGDCEGTVVYGADESIVCINFTLFADTEQDLTFAAADYEESQTVSSRLSVPDPVNNALDASAMALGEESFEGYDYTVEKTAVEGEQEETVYLITGTASAMTEAIATWYNDGDANGAAQAGDSYIVLKIFVGEGNTISYSSNDEEKSYTNTETADAGAFDGDYLFVCERLTGVYADETQVQTLDGVSYAITDASGETIEDVNIEFDMTTVAWDGESYSTAWYDKAESGTTEFTIYSAEELAGLANIVNTKTDSNGDESEMSFVNQKVKLGANIDLNSKNWTPIGHQKDESIEGATVTEYFDGDFDGNGFTIYNLDIEPGENVEHEQIGLFGHVFGGTFENIHVHNAKVVGTKNVGALIGGASAGNGSGGKYGQTCTVSNCTVDGLVDIEGNYQVGGLFGSVTKVKLENCSVNGDKGSKVTAWDNDSTNDSEYSAGGIVGCAVGDSESTSKIVETGNWTWSGLSVSGLSISSPARVGGIAGKYYDECGKLTMENCTVSDCELSIVQGSATTKNPTIGALIGVYVAQIDILDGNSVTDVMINYTSGQYIGGLSTDSTYLLFGGSEPVSGKESYAFVSFTDSEQGTHSITTSNLTAVKLGTKTGDMTDTD